MSGKVIESYNLINYLKIIDLSLLNLLDFIEINDAVLSSSDKLILNLNATNRKLLEGFIINNINNETHYGKHNILVNSCRPIDNWRNKSTKDNVPMIQVKDRSILVDEIKLNNIAIKVFNMLPTLTATFAKKVIGAKSSIKTSITIQKDLKLLGFKNLDLNDSYYILNKLLSTFGFVNTDFINYNIICDGNNEYYHNITSIGDELFDEVRGELMKEGII